MDKRDYPVPLILLLSKMILNQTSGGPSAPWNSPCQESLVCYLCCLLFSQVSLGQNRRKVNSSLFSNLQFFFQKDLFLLLSFMCICVSECGMYESGLRSQKRAPDSPALKLQAGVSCLLCVLRSKSQCPGRAARAHDH